MPTLPQILNQLQFITYEAALLGLFITAGIILAGRDWRWLILALLIQYILVGLILARLVRPDIATLKVMIGAFICPILFLSARQVSSGSSFAVTFSLIRRQENSSYRSLSDWWKDFYLSVGLLRGRERAGSPAATGVVFRILVVFLLILIATTLSNAFTLPGLTQSMSVAVYWLVLAGLITLTLTEDPIKVGHGLFTALTGFDLFYATVESSLLLTGLWGTINLLIALAVGYLTVVKGTGPEEER